MEFCRSKARRRRGMLALRCTDFGIIKRYGKIKRFTCAFVVPQTECGTEGPLPYQHIWSHLRLNHASSPACEPLHQSQRSPRNHTFFHEFHNPHRSDIYDRTAALLHHLWQVQFLLARTAEHQRFQKRFYPSSASSSGLMTCQKTLCNGIQLICNFREITV